MAIRKISQTPPTMASIVNTKNNSTTDAYSCDYVNKLNTYSTDEMKIGTWIDGKPIYRKVITATLNGTYTESGNRYTWVPSNLSNINITKINFVLVLSDRVSINTESSYISSIDYITSSGNANKVQIGSSISNVPINTPITIILEYTKNN